MADYIYTMQGLSKIHPPDKKVVSDVYLSFLPGAKIGVLGVNGAGKSSLLRIMAGVDTQYTGETWIKPGATVGYFSQEPDFPDAETVQDVMNQAVNETRSLLQRFEDLSMKLGESLSDNDMTKVIEEHGKVQDAIEACDGWNLDHAVELATEALCLPPTEASLENLSGGERRRVALCQVLLQRPDLLLLDEPTNHLDADSVSWLEQHLERYPGTVVAVTHDRYFLDNVARWILELDRGRAIPFEGNYSAWLEAKETRLAQEEKQDESRKRKIASELEWVRASPRARQAKSKARLAAYESLVTEEKQAKRDPSEIQIPAAPRLGDLVVEAKDVSKSFDDRALCNGLNFSIPKGAIVGVVGPNGAGKTTLCRMIVGQEEPDSGTMRVGESVKLAYVDQSRDVLNSDKNVWEEISGGADVISLGKQEMASRAYVSLFNFRGSDQQKKVGILSGGERNRVHLAKVLKSGGNFLILDEPTNDLDVDTLRSLESALERFSGCVLLVSHDRWFLNRIATHTLAFEGDGQVTWFDGNFESYEADRKRRLGTQAEGSGKARYRKLALG